MMTILLILGFSAIIYYIIFRFFKSKIPDKPIDKMSIRLFIIVSLLGVPLLLVALSVIVPLHMLREAKVQEWCRDNGMSFKFMVGDRNYPRLARSVYYKVYTSDKSSPINIKVGDLFWGLLSNKVTKN